jgi:hypothetical protein
MEPENPPPNGRSRDEEQLALDRHLALVRKELRELERTKREAAESVETLHKQLDALRDEHEDVLSGLYAPHFNFDTSEGYRAKIREVRELQRSVIRAGTATTALTALRVSGKSATESARILKQFARLLLRAFNGECDAAMANVTWQNITTMEERIGAAFREINDLGRELDVSIRREYAHLKIDGLRLVYEHEEKRHREQEEQRRIREQIREEEKAQRDFAKAQEKAEQEERKYARLLERARAEASAASGADLAGLLARVKELEAQLEAAQLARERAISRAQQTKSGFVYVISNVGSSGEGVFKVGLTRREDPSERVRELGDASVPFPYDVHAVLWADDAPALEANLHAALESQRVNLVNTRREFFKAELATIEHLARKYGAEVEFVQTAEAREYRQSVVARSAGVIAARHALEANSTPIVQSAGDDEVT